MVLDKKFLEILCCPKRYCRGDLEEILENGEPILVCKNCGDKYSIKGGIPILFPNIKYSTDVHRRHWDLEENAKSYAKKYNNYLKKQGSPWGFYTHISELAVVKRLTKNIDLKEKAILDAGCGNGRLLSSYPEAKIKIGLDTSLILLQETKKREPDFWLVCGQLEDMPFKDCVVDFSISIRVLQHLQVPEHAFAEMARVTKPSGHVALEIYNKFNLKEIYKRLRMSRFGKKWWPWGLDYDRYYSYREIEKWSRDNFVKPVKFAGAGWGINFYFFELIQFRRFAPKWFQKAVYGFFLFIENIVSLWPFFSKTMEKICFIGSIQGRAKKDFFVKRVVKKLKKEKDKKEVEKFQKKFENRNYCFVRDDFYHLNLSIDWLKKAQDSTVDAGVSRGFNLIHGPKSNNAGWQPSYPETTGYIIPTILKAAEIFKDNDLKNRARLMADWELSIMFPDGAVHGGNIGMKPNKAIFDTGQVIRGLVAIYKETKQEKYFEAAIKSSNWILDNEKNREGRWVDNNASCVDSETTTYNIYAIAPVVELGVIKDNKAFMELGRRVASFTISKQNEKGWFEGANFEKSKSALLHTIAYTIDGLWDIGVFLKEEKFIASAQKSLDGVLSQMDENGFIPGLLDENWNKDANWACLTGIAQIGVSCLKAYKKTGDIKYLEAAAKAKTFLKTCQNNYDEKHGYLGAMWGSWPISGGYGQNEALNWAVKYFADLLIDFKNI
ncbi:MAG: methyltransferase domain-containing protein [Patescibacteria group bacterium]